MSEMIDEVLSRMHNTAVEYYQGGNKSKNVYELLMLFHRDIEKAVKLEAVAKSAATTPTCKESLQVGNAAKMREALENIKECYENDYLSLDRDPGDVLGNAALLAENALSAPPRNCDVGTLEEQSKRFGKFCAPQKCRECSLYIDGAFGDCGVRWSQLPCESEVAQ